MMHWSSLRWCVHFFLLFTLLQTSVHDARLPLKFADYWQDNSRQADCSWNFIQTLEGWIHRFRGLLHKLYTCSISCLDKLCLLPSFLQYFCPFTLELLLQNSFQLKKITVIAMFLLFAPTLMMWKGLTGLLCHLIGHIWTFPANLLLLTSGSFWVVVVE